MLLQLKIDYPHLAVSLSHAFLPLLACRKKKKKKSCQHKESNSGVDTSSATSKQDYGSSKMLLQLFMQSCVKLKIRKKLLREIFHDLLFTNFFCLAKWPTFPFL